MKSFMAQMLCETQSDEACASGDDDAFHIIPYMHSLPWFISCCCLSCFSSPSSVFHPAKEQEEIEEEEDAEKDCEAAGLHAQHFEDIIAGIDLPIGLETPQTNAEGKKEEARLKEFVGSKCKRFTSLEDGMHEDFAVGE
jgi:hypothetical protein